MIVAFSTSSPWASVAVLDPVGRVLWDQAQEAARRASGACLGMLGAAVVELDIELEQVEFFAADIGPGSFTGVRVGVTLAKTLAFLHAKKVCGASAFDLIDADGVSVLPSKRDEYFVRIPGSGPERSQSLPAGPFAGYGHGIENPTYPMARRFSQLLERLSPTAPELFLPAYLIEPNISVPKTPFRSDRGGSLG